jgi:hypothetical protein
MAVTANFTIQWSLLYSINKKEALCQTNTTEERYPLSFNLLYVQCMSDNTTKQRQQLSISLLYVDYNIHSKLCARYRNKRNILILVMLLSHLGYFILLLQHRNKNKSVPLR